MRVPLHNTHTHTNYTIGWTWSDTHWKSGNTISYMGCRHRHTKPISKWFETSLVCSHWQRFSAHRFRPNLLHDVSWNQFGHSVKPCKIEKMSSTVKAAWTGAEMKRWSLAWCNSITFVHPTRNGCIVSVLDQQVRDHVQPKLVPNKQHEHERFLKTGFGKPIQPN